MTLAAIDIETPRRANTLLVAGDWACAHNDLGTLAWVAESLAHSSDEPLRHELIRLAHLCHKDAALASERWYELQERLRGQFSAERAE